MNERLCFLSAAELRTCIVRKDVSPVEITRAVLERAERLQPELNCFITLCGDEAMAAASKAEREVMSGQPQGLLHGIPFTVKDLVNTKGVRTTFGALPYKDNVPDHDAVAVARLRGQGAILVGKTTTPEFGTKCLTDSPLFGRTATPGAACVRAAAQAAARRWRLPVALRPWRLPATVAARPEYRPPATVWLA
jgi:aspartyl-tRNA(Asn)/glutamyl-tRNA(Gln) amidotransferase subunit A